MIDLDTPITVRDIIPQSYLKAETRNMTWDEYIAIPTDSRGGRKHRFVGHNAGIDTIGIPMVAEFLEAGGDDDGAWVRYSHHPVSIDGKEAVLRKRQDGKWRWALEMGWLELPS